MPHTLIVDDFESLFEKDAEQDLNATHAATKIRRVLIGAGFKAKTSLAPVDYSFDVFLGVFCFSSYH